MQIEWTDVLTAVVGNGALLAGACALLWKGIDAKLERQRTEMAAEREREIELYKAELSRRNNELQVAYSGLYAKRADAVAYLYAKLQSTVDALSSLVSLVEYAGEPSKQEKVKIFAEEYNAYVQFYRANRIYFPREICMALDAFNKKSRLLFNTFNTKVVRRTVRGDEADDDAWLKSTTEIQESIYPAIEAIEELFRKLLQGAGLDGTEPHQSGPATGGP